MQARLPGELLDIVIDHLHDDRRSLIACSLASRVLLGVARYHLFYRVNIDSDYSALGFHDFCNFLLRSPPAARLIQHLSFYAGWRTNGPHGMDSRQLGLIMDRCSSLRSLTLSYVTFHTNTTPASTDDAFAPWALTGWTLPRLTIVDTIGPEGHSHVASYLQIISAFRRIGSLSLHCRVLDNAEDPQLVEDLLPNDLEIDALSITIPPYEERLLSSMCRAICRTRTSQTLHKLDVVMRYNGYLNVINEVFKPACSELNEVQLDIRPYMTNCFNEIFRELAEDLPSLGVPQLPLTSVLLGLSAGTHVSKFCLCSLADVLSALPSSIRTLTVDIDVTCGTVEARSHVATVDWSRVGQQLARLKGLTRLTFATGPGRSDQSAETRRVGGTIKAMILEKLPSLLNKDLLLLV